MRLHLRSLGTLLLAIGVATCSDAPRAGIKTAPEGQAGRGRFSISPRFSPQAAAIYAQRATFAPANFDHVRIVITRPPNEVVIDTIITFNPASPPTTLDLFVDVKSTGEIFDGAIQYTNNGAVVYQASGKLRSYPPDQLAPTPQELLVVYVGPGANATRLSVTPATSTLVAPGSASFTATAFDANNTAVANVPITWSVSDASIATLSTTSGTSTSIATAGKRGSVTVTAATPTLSANATVTVSLPPSAIVLVSGGGQTGKAGAALASPGVVRVTASDGVGVAGVAVQFAAPNGGGVGNASATTDAQGQASSSLTLGGVVGAQSFAASAAGFSVSIPATATPGDPTQIAAVSGSGQTDTVSRSLRAPFVVKVSDRFGNGVGGVTVSWSKTSGGGTLSGSTSVSGTDGTASIGYTLGATVGQETVTASAAGITTPVTFTATAITGPANIAAVSGSGQTGRVAQALTNPLVVKVTDAAGNGVSGVVVFWSATNGTVSGGNATDAQGQTSATFTLGTTIGAASATASVNTSSGVRSATFSATVQPGTVARAVFRTGPSAVAVGAAMNPALQVELQDAGGNRTNAVNAVSIAIGANPGQATLGGTLTRSAVAGVATFDNLTLSAAGTGYTLVASSAGVPSITSAAFNVTGAVSLNRILFVDQETLAPLPSQPAPSVTMTAGVAPANPPAIRVLDPQGAPIANATVSYTVTRGAQTLFAGTPQTNAQGLITFATLSISPTNMQVAGNYSFVATLQGATGSPLTLPVTVVPAAPAKYIVTASTTTPAASGQSTITAQLADQFNNSVANAERLVSWTLSGSGGGTLAGANSSTNGQGQATIVYTAAAQPSGATVTVTAIDVGTPSITGAVTLTPQQVPVGPAARVAMTTQPSATALSGSAFAQQPVVQLVDASNNPVSQAGVVITAAIASGGGTLGGTTTATTTSTGAATFTNLSITGAAGSRTLSFSVIGLTSAISNTINVSVVSATAVAFLVQPSTTAQNSPISPAVQVRVVDASNNTVTTSVERVTLAIGTNPAGGTLSGTISLLAVNGIATFPGLSIDGVGAGYTLIALATGLTSATSTTFNITPVPNGLIIMTAPGTVTHGVAISPAPEVRLTRNGNNLLLAGVTVTASVVPSSFDEGDRSRNPRIPNGARTPGGARRTRLDTQRQMRSRAPLTLANATAVTDANGIARFPNLIPTGTGDDFRISFDASGPGFQVNATTGNLFLDPGPAATLMIFSGDNQSAPAGTRLLSDPTVVLLDAGGNLTVTPATTVTFATTHGTVNPTSMTIDANSDGFGNTQWTLGSSQGPATMTASATINGTPVTVTFHATATASQPASVVFISPQVATTPVGTPLPAGSYPKIRLLDGAGAPAPNQQVTFSTPGGGVCTIPGSSIVLTTDAQGEVGLTSGNFTFLNNAAGSCWVFMISNVGSAFAQFSLIAVPANQHVWTGAVSRAWTLPGNWLQGSVPTSANSVFIPGFPLQGAQITTAVATGAVTVEQTASQTVTLFSNATWTINGNLDAGLAGGISAPTGNGAAVILNAAGPTATVTGHIPAATRFGAGAGCTTTYNLVGLVIVWNPIVNCPVDLGANSLNISGALTVQNSGRLIMTQPQAVLTVGSDATFQGASEAGFLTEGAILINGQLRINTNNGFVQGPNTTLTITNSTRGIIVGAGVTAPVTVGNLFLADQFSNAVMSSPVSITAAGLVSTGRMTINSGTTFNVSGTAAFQSLANVTVSGIMNLNGTTGFLGTASVTGAGTLSVPTASTCTKQATATVNVTGSTPAFIASPAQCTNQIP